MSKQSEPSVVDDSAVPVLLTRPEDQSRAFAKDLQDRFGLRMRVVISPLMAPSYLSPELPLGPFEAVIFTSVHGFRAAELAGYALPKTAFCVGERTAAAARAQGLLTPIISPDADHLIDAILAQRPTGRLLHLCGKDTRGDVSARLTKAGISTEALVVYAQTALNLTDEARSLLTDQQPVIVPLFSPRSARLFQLQVPQQPRARLYIAAISTAVVESLDLQAVAKLETATHPDHAAMLDAVGNLLACV
jgi:uroporphyrinogen-III synthase